MNTLPGTRIRITLVAPCRGLPIKKRSTPIASSTLCGVMVRRAPLTTAVEAERFDRLQLRHLRVGVATQSGIVSSYFTPSTPV
jgi:hypothetical protein